jgi:chromosome segregation ATPase
MSDNLLTRLLAPRTPRGRGMIVEVDINGWRVRSVDELFAQLGDAATRGGEPPLGAAEPPAGGDHTDLRAQYEWLWEERQRLENYTIQQFAIIKQQREELMARRTTIEEGFALREQELNHQEKLLLARTQAVQAREEAVAERAAELALHEGQLAQLKADLRALRQQAAELAQANAAQRELHEKLRAETDHLTAAHRAKEAELAALAQSLDAQARALAEERALWETRRAELEQRYAALEKEEEALRRRLAELEEVETQLRNELEARERDLAAQAREIEQFRARLRAQAQRRYHHADSPPNDWASPESIDLDAYFPPGEDGRSIHSA